jgi:hypothetical protein
VEWETEEYIIYSIYDYKKKSNIFNKRIFDSIIKSLEEKIQSIQEVPLTILPIVRGRETLNGLFKEYFEDNYIIPCDMKERK